MYAIIKTGGKQYKVHEGEIIKIEKLNAEENELVEFDRVLAVSSENEEDGKVEFGQPFLEDAKVSGKVIEQGKNKKITVFKYKPKKRYRKKMGHRQPYTKVLIDNIDHEIINNEEKTQNIEENEENIKNEEKNNEITGNQNQEISEEELV